MCGHLSFTEYCLIKLFSLKAVFSLIYIGLHERQLMRLWWGWREEGGGGGGFYWVPSVYHTVWHQYPFIQQILCCAECLTHLIWSCPHSITTKKVLLTSVYRRENWGLEMSSSIPKTHEARNWTEALLTRLQHLSWLGSRRPHCWQWQGLRVEIKTLKFTACLRSVTPGHL